MASLWKGTLMLELVPIPIKIGVAAREERISFKMLHAKCGEQIKMKRHCPTHGLIEWNDVESGYEYKEGVFVTVSTAEKDSCEPESSKTMTILQSVAMSEVDATLLESSYYIEPEAPGKIAYKLLVEALARNAQYALARITMSSREHIVVLRPVATPAGPVLAMHTMFYQAEVRAAPSLGLDSVDSPAGGLEMVQTILQKKYAPFDHGMFKDGYQTNLSELLFAKQQGQAPKIVPKKAAAPSTVDLMSALSASMGATTPAVKGKPAATAKRRTA